MRKDSSFNSNGFFSKNNSFFNPADIKFLEEEIKNGKGGIHQYRNDEQLGSFKCMLVFI